jgi:gas vesicle protein
MIQSLRNGLRRETMKRKSHENSKNGAGKLITGILVGGVVGATIGWLTTPASGSETRRRLRGDAMDARGAQERAKTADGNVESLARELAGEVKNNNRKNFTTTIKD